MVPRDLETFAVFMGSLLFDRASSRLFTPHCANALEKASRCSNQSGVSRQSLRFSLSQWRHEGAGRAGQRAVVLDGQGHLTGVPFAVQHELLSVHGVGALSGLAHESEGGLAAGLKLQCEGAIRI